MMNKSILFCLGMIIPSILSAQSGTVDFREKASYIDQVQLGRNMLITYNLGHTELKGTPFLFEDFRKGDVYFSNKKMVRDLMINYNCFTGELLYNSEDITYIVNKLDIDYFTLTGDQPDEILLFKQVFIPDEKKRDFLQILYDEKTILFKRHLKEFKETEIKSPYHNNQEYDEYVDKKEYLVSTKDGKIVPLKPRKNSIMKTFPDQATVLEEFIKNEKINLKNETDLIRLIEYYDSL